MNIYQEWNFRDNPFKTTSLPAEPEGNKLIAGRETEIRKFLRRLFNQPQLVCVEGPNGIGKTSLINVSIFRAFQKYMENKGDYPLFVPCTKTFQLSTEVNSEDFIDEIYIEVAQTLIRYKNDLKRLKIPIPKNLEEIDKWLNAPNIKSYQGSFLEIGIGVTKESNTSLGFEKSGFRRVVQTWLKKMFPKENAGGIVCVIDNLELLEKSQNAKKAIENLRDTLFSTHGIRWVLCGSLGIVTSIVASPRLEGFLHDPIPVKGIEKAYTNEIYNKRIEAFKKNDKYYLPLTKTSFGILYEVLKNNIRNTLKYANDYCIWIDDLGEYPQSKTDKERLFLDWLVEKSSRYYSEIKQVLEPETMKLFENAIHLDGTFALGDYELFEFSNIQAMSGCVKSLESSGLVVSVIDEKDSRRKSIQVTPKGWFVSYAMN